MQAISFGEVLWDAVDGREYLGGAPLNLAAHLARLGCRSYLISAVGQDERGRRALAEINKIGVKTDFIQTLSSRPTGLVEVKINPSGLPTYLIHKNVAYDFIAADKRLIDKLAKEKFDVFCFGTLAQRQAVSRRNLTVILKNIKSRHIFYDINLRQTFYDKNIIGKSLKHSTMVKLNDDEAAMISKLLFGKNPDEQDFVRQLIKTFSLKIVIITKGASGSSVYSPSQEEHCQAVKIKVADTVGAGDAFSAGFLYKYFQTSNLKLSAEFASSLGSYVASKKGAIPTYTAKIKKMLNL